MMILLTLWSGDQELHWSKKLMSLMKMNILLVVQILWFLAESMIWNCSVSFNSFTIHLTIRTASSMYVILKWDKNPHFYLLFYHGSSTLCRPTQRNTYTFSIRAIRNNINYFKENRKSKNEKVSKQVKSQTKVILKENLAKVYFYHFSPKRSIHKWRHATLLWQSE